MAVTEPWIPSSWRSLPALQQPEWPDPAEVASVRERLQQLHGARELLRLEGGDAARHLHIRS